jgi:hypothetical protein
LGQHYRRVLIAVGVLILLALPTVFTRSAKPLAAGWDDLAFCLDLVSFDGTKRLALADDGVATLEDKATPDKQSIAGTWKLSAKQDRYLITFGDQETSFQRIAPPGADMCILAAGGSYAANQRLSWFAVRPDDGAPDE